MVCTVILHATRRKSMNIALLALTAFVAWGRWQTTHSGPLGGPRASHAMERRKMTHSQPAAATLPALLPADTRLGTVHLAITDAGRALAVWRDLLGLTVIGEEDGALSLGTGGQVL